MIGSIFPGLEKIISHRGGRCKEDHAYIISISCTKDESGDGGVRDVEGSFIEGDYHPGYAGGEWATHRNAIDLSNY